MTAAIETTGLGKRYGRMWALRDCSLALPEGRVVALWNTCAAPATCRPSSCGE